MTEVTVTLPEDLVDGSDQDVTILSATRMLRRLQKRFPEYRHRFRHPAM